MQLKNGAWCCPPSVVQEDTSEYMTTKSLSKFSEQLANEPVEIEDRSDERGESHGLSLFLKFPNKYTLSIQGADTAYSSPRAKTDCYTALEMAVVLPGLSLVMPKALIEQGLFSPHENLAGYAEREHVERMIEAVSILPVARFLFFRGIIYRLRWKIRYWRMTWHNLYWDVKDKGLRKGLKSFYRERMFWHYTGKASKIRSRTDRMVNRLWEKFTTIKFFRAVRKMRIHKKIAALRKKGKLRTEKLIERAKKYKDH